MTNSTARTEEVIEHTVYALQLPDGTIVSKARVKPDATEEERRAKLEWLARAAEEKAAEAADLGVQDYATTIVTTKEDVVIYAGPWAPVTEEGK
ncbi:hypothetical protein ACTHQY_15020 [Rhodococcoides corynebacterioides]|uniref:hypothetical protein n=1 Tax=Rhodococcoides corynebacterioides TaxID=53972 RepID=UPI003F80C262